MLSQSAGEVELIKIGDEMIKKLKGQILRGFQTKSEISSNVRVYKAFREVFRILFLSNESMAIH